MPAPCRWHGWLPGLVAVTLLAGCAARPPHRAGTATSPAASVKPTGVALCDAIDLSVVRSVVSVRDVPDSTPKVTNRGSAQTCSWQGGEWRNVDSNGVAEIPTFAVTLYRDGLDFSVEGEVPTTVAGQRAAISRDPGNCTIIVHGEERTLEVLTDTADHRRDSCPAATETAGKLAQRFLR